MRLNVHSPRNMNTFKANIYKYIYKIGRFLKILEQKRTEIQEQMVEKRVASGVSGLGVYSCTAEEEVRHTRTHRNR